MVTNSVKLNGKMERMDVKLGTSKTGKDYVSANLTLVVDDNKIVVRMFSMRYKANGVDELNSYKGIMTLYEEANAMFKSIKHGEADAIVEDKENNDTIVDSIEGCTGIKCSSWQDFKWCRLKTNVNPNTGEKRFEIEASHVNRFKENEECQFKNYWEVAGKVVAVPCELEDEDGNPFMKFTVKVPTLQKGYTRGDGVVVEDKVVLNELSVVSHDIKVFDYIIDNFTLGSIVSLNGEIVRRVERVQMEVEIDTARGFGRAKEVTPNFKTKITEHLEILGGFAYEEFELEEVREFDKELWEKAEELETQEQSEPEKPRGFGNNRPQQRQSRPSASVIFDDAELPF